MNKTLLGTLALVACAPSLVFASHHGDHGKEMHKEMGHSGAYHMSTGTHMDHALMSLQGDIAKLTPEQRIELTNIVRTYLTSKGITPVVIPTKEAIKTTFKENMEAARKAKKEAFQARREAMKQKREAMKSNANINTSRSNTKG